MALITILIKNGDDIAMYARKIAGTLIEQMPGIAKTYLPNIQNNKSGEKEFSNPMADRLYTLEKKYGGDRKKACLEWLDEIEKLPNKQKKNAKRGIFLTSNDNPCERMFLFRDFGRRFWKRINSNNSFTREDLYQEIAQLVFDIRFGDYPKGASNKEIVDLILYDDNSILELLRPLTKNVLSVVDRREKVLVNIREKIVNEAKKTGAKIPDKIDLNQQALDMWALAVQQKKDRVKATK